MIDLHQFAQTFLGGKAMPRPLLPADEMTPGGFLRSIRLKRGETIKQVSARFQGSLSTHVSSLENNGRKVVLRNLDDVIGAYQLSDEEKDCLLGLMNVGGETCAAGDLAPLLSLFCRYSLLSSKLRSQFLRMAKAYESSILEEADSS